MRVITVSGPPSSGKTSVIIKTIEHLRSDYKVGVVKFDCLYTNDDDIYKKVGVEVLAGLSGNLCPDHFFISNIEDCLKWGEQRDLDFLIVESAGLCNRCSPHIKECLAVCVIDNLSGVNTPKKIGPMLRYADIIVVTKGDIVSQAEREVFSYKVKQANPRANIIFINGITGQGSFDLGVYFKGAEPLINGFEGKTLRFTMPAALCSYCLGETRIGEDFQKGNVRKMSINL